MPEPIKYCVDATSFLAAVTAAFGLIPHAAALLSLVWVVMRIYNEYLVTKKHKRDLEK